METLTTNYGLRKQDENEFYTETINTDNMEILDPLIKSIDDKASTLEKITKYQTAAGTATAIVLNNVSFIDGFSISFVVLTSNGSGATTINGKPLYKPGTTTAPKLTAGKAATIWFSSVGDCFFIKASADGDAVVGDVLAGKIFSNDDDTGLIGTLALSGTAAAGDVMSGATFYKDDPKTKLTGTYSNIKSIQRGTVTFSTTDVTKAISINNVDLTKAIVLIEFSYTNTPAYAYYGGISGVLNSSVELLLSRFTPVTGTRATLKVSWQVIEFNNVKSLQKGSLTTAFNGTAYSVTISPVNTAKSILFFNYTNDTGNTLFYGEHLEGSIADSTTLNFYQLANAKTIKWQVIEFN